METSGKVTGSTKVTKTMTFVATSTTSYITVRSDKRWKYANARALSVKKVSCSEVAVAKVKVGYIKTSNHKIGGKGDNPVSKAYQKVLSDPEYIYHYKVLEQTSLGQVTKYLSGNGLVTKDAYNSAGTMTSSTTGYTFDGGEIRNLTYEYYDNYSLSKREDKKLGIEQDYIYDALDRIKISTVDGSSLYGSKAFSYDYDVYGNIKKKTGIEGTFEYFKGTHKVKKAGAKAYSYDPNGNMVKNGNSTIEYNAINKATNIKTKDKTLTFTYDMNGNRYQKSEKFTDTYYIGKGYEYTEDGNRNKTHKYLIYANGKVVTVHDERTQIVNHATGEQFTTHNTQYLHYDSLGSVDTITNQQGSVVERMAYKPFGEQIDLTKLGKSITNRGYTGHEHIKGTDFIHMNARLYDPTIGRFLSADTYIQAPFDSQSYNRYSYVRNNPLKYTNPTGHFWGMGSWIKEHDRISFDLGHNIMHTTTVMNFFGDNPQFGNFVGVIVGYYGGPGASAGWSAYMARTQGASNGAIIKTAAISYASSMAASEIGNAYGHNTSLTSVGGTTVIGNQATQITMSMAIEKAIVHGVVRGLVHVSQGGKFGSGFASGFISSGFSVGNRVGGNSTGAVLTRTAIMAVVGGTTSHITGGKFANGAMSGAFVHMYNAEGIAQKIGSMVGGSQASSQTREVLNIDSSGERIIASGMKGLVGGAISGGVTGSFVPGVGNLAGAIGGGIVGLATGLLKGVTMEIMGIGSTIDEVSNVSIGTTKGYIEYEFRNRE